MEYSGEILPGRFIARPNRFIAHVEINGCEEICHVKNTGRCRELLQKNAAVYVEKSSNPNRKTLYDLIAVEKRTERGTLLINVDSQAPNRAAAEVLPKIIPGLTLLRPETFWGSSRFDFYCEAGEEKWFVEVKGVTLEDGGVARFPDAPTIRGARHLRELCRCREVGFRAGVIFLIQMKGVHHFEPNSRTDPDFTRALREAAESGVKLWAMDCEVTPRSLTAGKEVPIRL